MPVIGHFVFIRKYIVIVEKKQNDSRPLTLCLNGIFFIWFKIHFTQDLSKKHNRKLT